MKILDGKIVRDEILASLKVKFAKLAGISQLAIIQVGDRVDSAAYIRQKKIFADKIGVKINHLKFPENCPAAEIKEKITLLNADPNTHGIIVQLPLPTGFSVNDIMENINWCKDVDGLTATNLRRLLAGDLNGLIPATARGILQLLDYYEIPITGKKVTVIGRSLLVGKPVALALLARGATVTIGHRQTENLAAVAREADILITATGSRGLIKKDFVRSGQSVIDVGNDVDLAAVKDVIAAITPTPGGVGPMTVACLFENLLKARIISGQ